MKVFKTMVFVCAIGMASATMLRDAPVNEVVRGFRCNSDLLKAYGLTGQEGPRVASDNNCPLVSESCCTAADEQTAMKLWKEHYMPRLAKNYELYLYSVRFLLGYAHEGSLLAGDYLNLGDQKCSELSLNFKAIYTNPTVNSKIYKLFVDSLERMADIRRGVFCVLCDSRFHKELGRNSEKGEDYSRSRLTLSKNFCSKLTQNTIQASYYSVMFLPAYVQQLSGLIECKTKTELNLTFDVEYWTRQHVKNCYYFGKKYFFFYCERYCELFSLTTSSQILDGQTRSLRKFIDHVISTRDDVFYKSRVNSLVDTNLFQTKFNEDFFEETLKTELLFPAMLKGPSLSTLRTDILFEGGYDLYLAVDQNAFPLYFDSAPRLLSAVLLALFAAVF